MKTLLYSCLLGLLYTSTTAQVGIGNSDPQAVLDIRSSNQSAPSNSDGILIPKADNFPVTNPGANQDGMLLYITGFGTPNKGFYFWNNADTNWISIDGRLEHLDEGNGYGWRLKDINSANYGTIGNGAVDLSNQFINDSRGATGSYSFATGFHTYAEGTAASAFGDQTHAQGQTSTAFGQATIASGDYSTSFGFQSEASANHSTAFGNQNVASGLESTAFGRQNIASGITSTAIGTSNVASGLRSITLGYLNTASGLRSTAIGITSSAIGSNSIAIGNSNAEASGEHSTAFGRNTRASGTSSTTIGYGTLAQSFGEVCMGLHNTDIIGNNSSFVMTDRLLVVGNGFNATNRSDALVILKNGTITAPSFEISEITDNKALITKEYADATYVGGAVEVPVVALLNATWSHYNSLYIEPSYYKHDERVYLAGLLRKTGAYSPGEVIFTLPLGYRPSARVLTHGTQGSNSVRIDILADGSVIYLSGGVSDFISLEGISFRAN